MKVEIDNKEKTIKILDSSVNLGDFWTFINERNITLEKWSLKSDSILDFLKQNKRDILSTQPIKHTNI